MTADAQSVPQEVIGKQNELPEGKVRTSSGEIIDRADACFGLRALKKDESILIAADGTAYKKKRRRNTETIDVQKEREIIKE